MSKYVQSSKFEVEEKALCFTNELKEQITLYLFEGFFLNSFDFF
jgi:hypothetical protein